MCAAESVAAKDDGKDVVVCWVLLEVQQVLDGPALRAGSLGKVASHGQHGQAPVLDLLHRLVHERMWVFGHAEGVERRATGVVLVPWQKNTDRFQAADAHLPAGQGRPWLKDEREAGGRQGAGGGGAGKAGGEGGDGAGKTGGGWKCRQGKNTVVEGGVRDLPQPRHFASLPRPASNRSVPSVLRAAHQKQLA